MLLFCGLGFGCFFFKSRLVSFPLHNQLCGCWLCVLTHYSFPSGFAFCIANKTLLPTAFCVLYFPRPCPWASLWHLAPVKPPFGRGRGPVAAFTPPLMNRSPGTSLPTGFQFWVQFLFILQPVPCCQARPGQARMARGRNRKARILLPKHGNGHLSGTESREERSLRGHRVAGETMEEPQPGAAPAPGSSPSPGAGTVPTALTFITCKEPTALLGAITEPAHSASCGWSPPSPLGARQHPPPAVTQAAAPPSTQPARPETTWFPTFPTHPCIS